MPTYTAKSALLGSIIDYAGTFPPAALPLEQALKKAATWRREAKHPWLMAKIALPIADIKKITARTLFESGADGAAWLFTALGSFGKDTPPEEFTKSLEWDLREIRRCNERGVDASLRQWIVAYETRLPAADVKFEPLLDRVATLTSGQIAPFFEIAFDANIEHVADTLNVWMEENVGAPVVPGIKVRTGGAYVPTPQELARVVVACVSRGLRFKATQGLHHVLTHDKSIGFLNLFAALAFAQGRGTEKFTQTDIETLLADDTRRNFEFTETKFRWRDQEIDCDTIEAARRRHGATFGSCSLDEPDQFLFEEKL